LSFFAQFSSPTDEHLQSLRIITYYLFVLNDSNLLALNGHVYMLITSDTTSQLSLNLDLTYLCGTPGGGGGNGGVNRRPAMVYES